MGFPLLETRIATVGTMMSTASTTLTTVIIIAFLPPEFFLVLFSFMIPPFFDRERCRIISFLYISESKNKFSVLQNSDRINFKKIITHKYDADNTKEGVK